jgi:hypothetical protein
MLGHLDTQMLSHLDTQLLRCSDTWSVTGCLYALMLRLRCSELKLRGSNLEAQKLRSLESEVQKHSHSDAQTWTLRTQTQRLGGSEPGIQKLSNWRLRCSDLGYSDSDAQTQMLGAQAQRLELRVSDTQNQTLRCSELEVQMLRFGHSDSDTQTQMLGAQSQMLGHSDLRCSDAWSLRSQMLRCLHSDTWSLRCSDTQSLGLDSEPQMLRCSDSDTWNFGSSDLRKLVIDHMM